MKGRKWRAISAFITMGALVVLFCAASAGEHIYRNRICMEAIKTMLVNNRQNRNISAGREDAEPWVTAVMTGDAESLVGFPFGTEFDYEKFEQCGWYNGSILYCLQDGAYDGLNYTFDGEGHCFNGIVVSFTNSFFDWTTGEDTLDAVIDLFGVPDSFGENVDGEGVLVAYEFGSHEYGRATLSVKIVERKIRAVFYTATGETLAENAAPKIPTDYERDMQADHDEAEMIYEWGNEEGAHYGPYDEGYDLEQVDAFVEDYLCSQGMESMTPDGVSAVWDEDSYAAYYIDRKQQKCCFVVHIWGDYWVDYEAGISRYGEWVYCTACDFNEAEHTGNIIYHYDTAQGITQETAYDAWGKRMSDISYAYVEGVPFPFVTDCWNIDEGTWVLCRDQKTWFYKESAIFDESGSVIGTQETADMPSGKVYFPYNCTFHYDENGSLVRIREELQPYDIEKEWDKWHDWSGQMEFSYREDGSLAEADYERSYYTHGGTTDFDGSIAYDEQGRMIYKEYYVTHGSHADIYLYEGDETRPWARLNWCSSKPGIEGVSIFAPEENT